MRLHTQHRINADLLESQGAYNDRLGSYLAHTGYSDRFRLPGVIDMAFGDPHHMTNPGLVNHLQYNMEPEGPHWFAYAREHRPAQIYLAESLSDELDMEFEPTDIRLTNGAFGGIMTCLKALCGRNTEVIYLSPSWFYYEPMIASIGATSREVRLTEGDWRLDIDEISNAINEQTSAIIINSPNNPTGVVHSDKEFSALSDVLAEASDRYGHPIYVISDEAYRKIVFDDEHFASPLSHYPYSLQVYTYTKTLLTPGERVGFIAVPPSMPHRRTIIDALELSQITTGWAFPNSSLMYAIPELESFAISIPEMQSRRDFLVEGLHGIGYKLRPCQGTFYLLLESPFSDDWEFAAELEKQDLFVLPGSTMKAPGHLRISLTVTDDMAEEALNRFRACWSSQWGG